MLLLIPLIAGLGLGLLAGGSFKTLADTRIRFGWLFVLGLVLQLSLFTSLTDTQYWDLKYGSLLYVLSLVMVFGAIAINARNLQWPVYIVIAGAALNLLVIVLNGGYMPVDTHLLALAQGQDLVSNVAHHRFAINVAPLTGSTRFGFLGDRIGFAGSVYSVGDLTLAVGAFFLAAFQMVGEPGIRKLQTRIVHRRTSTTQAA